MPEMLSTAISGLLSFQRALSTTSHNISNVNTEGYSRQKVDLQANTPTFTGNGYIGNGVHVDSVQRIYNEFLTNEVRDTTSSFSRVGKLADLGAQIDNILADPVGGISPILQNFFSSVQDVADDPASSTARYEMISSAQTLADRYNNIDNRFEEIQQNLITETRIVVGEINTLITSIRDVNMAINESNANGVVSNQSADLLDKRDLLLTQLSEKVDISVITDSDNQVSIFIGKGQTMLTGTNAFSLSSQSDPADPMREIITYNGLVTAYDISDSLSGGELGGILEFEANYLLPARNALGRSAIGLAETFNAQMRDGMDLNGNLGQNFFTYTAPQSISSTSNAGTATVSTVVSDVTALSTDDYQLDFDGANWVLTSDSGTNTTVADASPATTTIIFEGLTLSIDGTTAVAGDQFTIKPTIEAAARLQTIISDPNLIAAAAPILSAASLANLGSVEISAGQVTDITDANLLNTATLTFDNPATTLTADVDVVVSAVTYLAGAAIPYSNNMIIEANGWQVNLNGTAEAGDVFTVSSNAGGSGDNRNALNLANLQNTGIFDGGVANYQEDYGTLVGQVGSRVAAANLERDAQQTLLLQTLNSRDSVTGVNLDEEAADLVRYQQAYEATARIISTAQTIFETLLNSTR
ncbi:MAG: flagellar hook-associated protein FlgK [Gammaproteobacteria bacterium]|nr:flagellar hook-associated protein FlgK [Gammaproteobacteria bacterium]